MRPLKPVGKTLYILTDEFEGIELHDNRAAVAAFYLKGNGIEIGALHKPLPLPATAVAKYIDYKTLEENRIRYPELSNETIVFTHIIDDGFVMSGSVPANSQDFVIANHALEHSPDPLGTLGVWLGKLKQGGIIYAAIPIAEKCYDKGRPITSLEHFIADRNAFASGDKKTIANHSRQHLEEFIQISGANIARMNNIEPAAETDNAAMVAGLIKDLSAALEPAGNYAELMGAHIKQINRVYDIHYHTFSPSSYETMLRYFCDHNNAVLENVVKNGSGECIAVVRKS